MRRVASAFRRIRHAGRRDRTVEAGTPRELRLSAMADTRHVPAADLAAAQRSIGSVLVEEAC